MWLSLSGFSPQVPAPDFCLCLKETRACGSGPHESRMLERLAWVEDVDPCRMESFSAAFSTGLNVGRVLLTNEISRFSLIFCHQASVCSSRLTMRLNPAFRVSLLFSYA
jgi:hypothetical protein